MKDDSGHVYDESITFNVSAANFNNALTAVSNSNSTSYNLGSNNCTDQGLGYMAAAGITMAPTAYTHAGFNNTPADYGLTLFNSGLSNVSTTASNAPIGHGPCN